MVEIIRDGTKCACRSGWNGKRMYVYIEQGKIIEFDKLREPIKSWLGKDMVILPHFNMKTATGEICVGWLASQTDMLSDDWEILN